MIRLIETPEPFSELLRACFLISESGLLVGPCWNLELQIQRRIPYSRTTPFRASLHMPGHKENASQAENIGFAAQEPVKAVAAPKAARARPSATGTRQTRTEQLKKEDIGTVTLRRSPRFLVAEDASTFTLVETREPLAPLSRTNTRVTRSATPKQQLFNLPADLPKLPELPLTKSDLAPFLKTHDTWKSIRKGPFLASGGYGTVYAAVKRGGRAVAVKQISVAVDQKLDTFDHLLLPEFDLLSQMQEHPNIAGYFILCWGSMRLSRISPASHLLHSHMQRDTNVHPTQHVGLDRPRRPANLQQTLGQ